MFDRRSGLFARFSATSPLPSPELIELSLVGPGGELFDLSALRRLLDGAPLCRQVLLVGDSETHPALASILRTIRGHGVVPMLVVSSPKPRADVIEALARFAGYVAVDCGFNRTQVGLTRIYRDAGLRVYLNLPVADATTEWLASALEGDAFEHLVQCLVLTGRTASGPKCQSTGLDAGPMLDRLAEVVGRTFPYRIATDARIAPRLLGDGIGHAATNPHCEAALGGLFVNHDQTVTPCSLLPRAVLGSLEQEPLEAIWNSRAARDFRRDASKGPPPCLRSSTASSAAVPAQSSSEESSGIELRFGFASSSLCDRAILPLSRGQLLHILTSVKDWSALRFFTDPRDAPTQVAASWASLEYFLSLPPLWGQDLARLHEQLVAGTFEGQEAG